MNKETKQTLGIILISLAVIFIIFLRAKPKNDLELCRDIFWGFVEGRQSLQNYIDWEHLRALGLDVGATYRKLPNPKEKEDYRREFYKNFSVSFKRNAGRFEAFTNWRIYEKAALGTIIAADYKLKSKTALFTLSGFENKKLTNIKWEGAGE